MKNKWKVSAGRLVLIILTFALGGSLCGFAGRRLLAATGMEPGVPWITSYIILITLLWPVCVIIVSIPLGQFGFFKNYLSRLWSRISRKKQAIRVAIFASGAGSNAEQIIGYFRHHKYISIALVVCNKPGAGVIEVARRNSIEVLMIERNVFQQTDEYVKLLQLHRINWIILAGFLWKIPTNLIETYRNRIMNIHPALLPKYGGKGMYGTYVHEAVIAAGEKESGITIHYADEVYDHGRIIYQEKCDIEPGETAASLAEKIHRLEHDAYPRIIEQELHKK